MGAEIGSCARSRTTDFSETNNKFVIIPPLFVPALSLLRVRFIAFLFKLRQTNVSAQSNYGDTHSHYLSAMRCHLWKMVQLLLMATTTTTPRRCRDAVELWPHTPANATAVVNEKLFICFQLFPFNVGASEATKKLGGSNTLDSVKCRIKNNK